MTGIQYNALCSILFAGLGSGPQSLAFVDAYCGVPRVQREFRRLFADQLSVERGVVAQSALVNASGPGAVGTDVDAFDTV